MKPLISTIIIAVLFVAVVGWVLYVTSLKVCQFCDQPTHSGIQILPNAMATDKVVIMPGEIPFPLTDEQIYEWYKGLRAEVEAMKEEIRKGKFGEIECESLRVVYRDENSSERSTFIVPGAASWKNEGGRATIGATIDGGFMRLYDTEDGEAMVDIGISEHGGTVIVVEDDTCGDDCDPPQSQ